MRLPEDHATMGGALFEAASRHRNRPLLAVPSNAARDHDPQGRELSFADVATEVRRLMARYAGAGYGLGHRVDLLLDNRLEHLSPGADPASVDGMFDLRAFKKRSE